MIVLVAALASACAGQSIVTFQNQIVTRAGHAVPGIPGSFFGALGGASPPALQDDGRVLFHAQFSGGTAIPGVNDRALFHGDKGGLVKVLRWGEPEPTGTPGANIGAIQPNHVLSPAGHILVGANLVGPSVTASTDFVLYSGTPGNLQLVAREGSQAAGCPPGTIHATGSGFGGQAFAMNNNDLGHVAFTNVVSGAMTGKTLFAGSPGSIVRVMTENDVLGTNLTVASLGSVVQMNASGQVLLESVRYQTVFTTPIVDVTNDNSSWIYTPGLGATQVVREGSASPILGAVLADPLHCGGGQRPTFNASGQILMASKIVNAAGSSAVTFGIDDVILLLVTPPGGQVLVARKGAPAPGLPGTTLQLSPNVEMLLNDAGTVAFCSQIAGPGITTANDSGLWVGTPGNLTLVAWEGMPTPGLPGFVFGDVCGVKLLNGAGQLVFHASIPGLGIALACWDAVAGLQWVTVPGDTIEVAPGNFQPFSFGSLAVGPTGNTRSVAFGHDGTLLGLGANSVVKTRIGSNTGLPKTISASAGGVHSLFLNATSAHASQVFLVAGSVSGTSPGTQAGSFVVPLNVDFYTNMTIASPNVPPFGNTFGALNGAGRAVATITIPPGLAGISGLVLNHAFVAVDGSNALAFVSEPSSLTITP